MTEIKIFVCFLHSLDKKTKKAPIILQFDPYLPLELAVENT